MSALPRLDVMVDGSTARLIAAARATQACESLPKESARALVALARGCRLYLEARQRTLALAALDDIEQLLTGCDDDALAKAYAELIGSVRNALRWKPKPGEAAA